MALRRSQRQVQSPTFTAHVAKSIGSIKPRRLGKQSIDENDPDAELILIVLALDYKKKAEERLAGVGFEYSIVTESSMKSRPRTINLSQFCEEVVCLTVFLFLCGNTFMRIFRTIQT